MEPCEFTQRLQKKLIAEIATDLRNQGYNRAMALKQDIDNILKQPESKWFSVEGVAAELSVSTETVRRWIRAGTLKAVRAGRQYRISPDDMQQFLERGEQDKEPGQLAKLAKVI